MSQWLANIFEQQASRRSGDDEGTEQLVPALTIEHRGLRYVSDFSYLSEVIENALIVPYPEKHSAHIGIINMRGAIVPVLCLAALFGQDEKCCLGERAREGRPLKYPRMVVFCSPAGSFAVGASHVKKCLVPREKMQQCGEIEIEGKVYRILNENFFLRMEEMVA